MTLFTPDLYRHFAFGFVAGALLVGAASIDNWAEELAPEVQAAEAPVAPPPSDKFWTLAD